MQLKHIAIIMDGNRRFAKNHNMPVHYGHKKGAEKIELICNLAKNHNVKYITLFAFSYENKNRSREEVESLNNLLDSFLTEKKPFFLKNKIKFLAIGDITFYSSAIQNKISDLQKSTENFTEFTLIIALNYGSRQEILYAINKLKHLSDIKEEDVSLALYTGNIPEPDLLIRTGGTYRISNFLLWQITYTELFFTPKLWPEFTKEDFTDAINFYTSQKRNFGK